jgi:hypothetical protein
MEPPEQCPLSGELALARADRRVEDRPGGQRDQDHDPGDREPAAGLLVAMLGILGLVLGGVGHADRRAIGDDHAAAVEEPGVGDVSLEAVGGLADQPGEDRLGEALPCLAVPSLPTESQAEPTLGQVD